MSFSFYNQPTAYVRTQWRYLLYFSLFATELSLILSPLYNTSRSLITYLFPTRVPYQHILFLHQLFMFLSIALSRVAPVLFPVPMALASGAGAKVLESVVGLVGGIEADVNQMLTTELTALLPPSSSSSQNGVEMTIPPPFTSLPQLTSPPPEEIIRALEGEMERMVVEGTLREEARSVGNGGGATPNGSPLRGSVKGRGLEPAVRAVFERFRGLDVGSSTSLGMGLVPLRRVSHSYSDSGGPISSSSWWEKTAFATRNSGGRWDGDVGYSQPSQQRPSTPPPPAVNVKIEGVETREGTPVPAGLGMGRPAYVRARSVSC